MTLAEAMAIAVLKGDHVAAYALADKLIEERQEKGIPLRGDHETRSVTGYEVYNWPEFEAFARRLGFKYDLATRDVTIRLTVDEFVVIEHNYQARENSPPDEN